MTCSVQQSGIGLHPEPREADPDQLPRVQGSVPVLRRRDWLREQRAGRVRRLPDVLLVHSPRDLLRDVARFRVPPLCRGHAEIWPSY